MKEKFKKRKGQTEKEWKSKILDRRVEENEGKKNHRNIQTKRKNERRKNTPRKKGKMKRKLKNETNEIRETRN